MKIVWITGRPASGKTTLARRIVSALEARGSQATLVDSDEFRAQVTPHPTYTADERAIVYRGIAYVARRLAEASVIAVVAATAHDRALRDAARAITGPMLLVYARCPLSVCESRDPKGIYARGRAEAEGTVPGIHLPFFAPEDADLVIDTDRPPTERDLEPVLSAMTDER